MTAVAEQAPTVRRVYRCAGCGTERVGFGPDWISLRLVRLGHAALGTLSGLVSCCSPVCVIRTIERRRTECDPPGALGRDAVERLADRMGSRGRA